MSYEYHQLTVEDQIATILFDHPPLNINSEAVMAERCGVMSEVVDREDVRVIILTNSVPDYFGAGSDLREYTTESKETYQESTARALETARCFIQCDKISIAAINGNAIGSSADLTLMCDIRIMGQPYYLRWPEAYLAMMPNWGAATILPMLVGRSHALEWLLSGREIHTPELQEAGLLHGIYAPNEVIPQAQKMARHLRRTDKNSVEAIKSAVLHSFYMPLDYAFTADVKISTRLFGEPENKRRTQIFLEQGMKAYMDDIEK